MDIPQLKRLAGHVRSLLEQANHAVSHSQSLELIAALPGLRNWPEVQAFPNRVAVCELDLNSAGRLAYRLKRKFAFDASPEEVLAALNPQRAVDQQQFVPQIWPAGPTPGVYVTTDQAAIDALVTNYEEATDGALLYAERAASGAEGAIDLGEYGLWSSGLDRVPSGTLIVVGPIELVQDEWKRSAERLQMACTLSGLSGHRVAVLVKTPAPADLCEDIRLLAVAEEEVAEENDSSYCEPTLRGVVTNTGELVQRVPFARPWPPVTPIRNSATPEAIPAPARHLLTEALQERKSGLLVFGSEAVGHHWAADLVDAALALTEDAGPAARIMPRTRGTPSKDWQVPEATKMLPFLPSIESAYDRGYRRMVIDPRYVEGDVLKKFAGDVLFIAGTHDYEVATIVYGGICGFASAKEHIEFLAHVLALVGVVRVPTKDGVRAIVDVFLGSGAGPAELRRGREIGEYVAQRRKLKWEDEVQQLINSGEVTVADLKSADIRPSIFARLQEQSGANGAEASA